MHLLRPSIRSSLIAVLALLLVGSSAFAQNDYYFPNTGADLDPAIPTPEQFLGYPIGSHYTRADRAHVDLTGVTAHDPQTARAVLKGMRELTLVLPPPPYARRAGEIVAAQLAQVGVAVKIRSCGGRPTAPGNRCRGGRSRIRCRRSRACPNT